MSGLEISKTIFPFSKGHQIAIENNSFNQAYISIAYGDLCMVETVRWWSRGGGSVVPPKKGPLFVVLSEYANQSHNFTNLDFCDVTPLFAIGNRTIPHPPPPPEKKSGR